MEDTTPTHQVFFLKMTKALKLEGFLRLPSLKRPDNRIKVDYQEKSECIADSIELQCSYTSPSHDPQHNESIEEEVCYKASFELRDNHISPVSLDEVHKLVKNLKAK
ncbi:hypothetical protein EVAR_7200_1 [Eumeta japonica]|uniref:Uncharacterized protein n=1 Tax=Eumeta variegata TaxID=151549 RepID=A0A4C1T2D8_EUMVA|nr:hypothetical protein EVAR_7200_1 [Eumeta japonica]